MKKGVLIGTLIFVLSLIAATTTGAKELYETKPVPTEERHYISEIIDHSSKWEKLLQVVVL